MGDDKELLESGPKEGPRGWRLAALTVLGLAVCGLVAVRVWPGSAGSQSPSAAPAGESSATAPASSGPRPWPTAPEACGGEAELPVVASGPVAQRTGIELLVGGAELLAVDFDSGSVTAVGVRLRSGEYVVGLAGTTPTYAVTGVCTTMGSSVSRLIRVGADGTSTTVALPGPVGSVLADGPWAWGVTFPDEQHPAGSLLPVGGGLRVPLPVGLWPTAVTGGVVVGGVGSSAGGGAGSLLLVDAVTGRLRGNLGAGAMVAAGHGQVLWTTGCDPSVPRPCTLHRRLVAGGATTSFRLPRPPGFAAGVISPDGRLLAFIVERAGPDPRFTAGHPLPPADVAVLHLDTGELDLVPGVEIPAKNPPGLVFSTDSRWLVMALNAGTATRLLAWRPGLPAAYETTPIPGLVWGPPAVDVPTATAG